MVVRAAIVVAHPDDETIWAGGLILSKRDWEWEVFTLCRAGDTDRAPKFYQALKKLNATGRMDDMDDGPAQIPLDESMVKDSVLGFLRETDYDILITHNPSGEYTRHIRHEEVSKAVIELWHKRAIIASELWTFAYEDEDGNKYPAAMKSANLCIHLPPDLRREKNRIITGIYGFPANSFEANAAADSEAFWQFKHHDKAMQWLEKGGKNNN